MNKASPQPLTAEQAEAAIAREQSRFDAATERFALASASQDEAAIKTTRAERQAAMTALEEARLARQGVDQLAKIERVETSKKEFRRLSAVAKKHLTGAETVAATLVEDIERAAKSYAKLQTLRRDFLSACPLEHVTPGQTLIGQDLRTLCLIEFSRYGAPDLGLKSVPGLHKQPSLVDLIRQSNEHLAGLLDTAEKKLS